MERLVSKLLPPPYQLDPLLGSYYSNATGLFRGDVRYYNLSSIPYDTDVTWKPIADRVMENANLSAIPERLGTRNWSAADTIGIRVHDRMMTVANVSESIALLQVLCPLFYCVCLYQRLFSGQARVVRPRGHGNHSSGVWWSALHEEWLFLCFCSRGRVCHAMRLPRKIRLTCFQFLVCRHAAYPGHRSHRCAERYSSGFTGRDESSPVKAKDNGGLGDYASRAIRLQR